MHTKSKLLRAAAPGSPHAIKKNSFSSSAPTGEERLSDGGNESSGFAPKPPARPHYTSRYKDGKQFVGVEASLGTSEANKNNANNAPNLTIDGVSLQNSSEVKNNLLGGYHRSRERTRRSAVLKLLERKQKAQEKEKEKEQLRERNNRARSFDSLRAKQQQFDFIRDRSWARVDSSKKKSAAFKSFTDVEENGEEDKEEAAETESDELILQDKLNQFRFSRSVSGQYRSSRSCERADVTTKTYISIGPGKPTRIREHSPVKSTPPSPPQPQRNSEEVKRPPTSATSAPSENKDDCPPIPPERRRRSESPLKNFNNRNYNNNNKNNLNNAPHRDTSPSKSSERLQQESAPLKSTGLLRDIPINISNTNYFKESGDNGNSSSGSSNNNNASGQRSRKFSTVTPPSSTQHFTTRTTTTTNTTFKFPGFAPNQRKRSFTTQKTIHINNGYAQPEPAPRNRRVSDVGPRLPPMDIESSSSSGTSSYHSSPSSSARSSEERDFSYRPNSSCSSSFSSSSLSGSTDSVDSTKTNDSGLSKRRASLEKRFQERSSRIPSPERKTSTHINPGAAAPAPPSLDEEDSDEGSSSGFSSASSRLLFNLSSGYRYYRAQASNAPSAKTSYQQRRFSHDHTNERFRAEQENQNIHQQQYSQFPPSSSSSSSYSSSRGGSSVNSRGSSPPLRKISLPPTCYEDPERSLQSARRWEQFHAVMERGGSRYTGVGAGHVYSKYKLCDDTLHYPGCCPEHDKAYLLPPPSSSSSSSSPAAASAAIPSSSSNVSSPSSSVSSFQSPLDVLGNINSNTDNNHDNNLNHLSSYASKLKSGDSGLGGELGLMGSSGLLQGRFNNRRTNHKDNYDNDYQSEGKPPPLFPGADLASPADSDNFSVASSSCCSLGSGGDKDKQVNSISSNSRISQLRSDMGRKRQQLQPRRDLTSFGLEYDDSCSNSTADESEASSEMYYSASHKNLMREPRAKPPLPRRSSSSRKAVFNIKADAATVDQDEVGSVSTVSGSGMEFFRKFVQRKTTTPTSCKDCETQFRRDVLIDRLVSDSSVVNSLRSAKIAGESEEDYDEQEEESKTPVVSRKNISDNMTSSSYCSRCSSSNLVPPCSRKSSSGSAAAAAAASLLTTPSLDFDSQSISTRSSMTLSTVSGTGLRFLRNYLKKKNVHPKAGSVGGQGSLSKGNSLKRRISKGQKQQHSRLAAAADTVNSQSRGGDGGESLLLSSSSSCNTSNDFFNSIPVPFPPTNDFFGPIYVNSSANKANNLKEEAELEASGDDDDDDYLEDKRHSIGSTIAELLNETFDSDDSELLNLDWDECWDENDEDDSVSNLANYDEDINPFLFAENLGALQKCEIFNNKGSFSNEYRDEDEDEEDDDGRHTVIESLKLSSPSSSPRSCRSSRSGSSSSSSTASNISAAVSSLSAKKKTDDFGKKKTSKQPKTQGRKNVTKECEISSSLGNDTSSLHQQQRLNEKTGKGQQQQQHFLVDKGREEGEGGKKETFRVLAEEEDNNRISAARSLSSSITKYMQQERNSSSRPSSQQSSLCSSSSLSYHLQHHPNIVAPLGGEESSSSINNARLSVVSDHYNGSNSRSLSTSTINTPLGSSPSLAKISSSPFGPPMTFCGSSSNNIRSKTAAPMMANLRGRDLQQQQDESSSARSLPKDQIFGGLGFGSCSSVTSSSRRSSIVTNKSSEYSDISRTNSRNSRAKSRLAEFWEQKVSAAKSIDNLTADPARDFNRSISDGDRSEFRSFRPAMPSYYYDPDPDACERIQKFLDVTRRAAKDESWKRTSYGSTNDLSLLTFESSSSSSKLIPPSASVLSPSPERKNSLTAFAAAESTGRSKAQEIPVINYQTRQKLSCSKD